MILRHSGMFFLSSKTVSLLKPIQFSKVRPTIVFHRLPCHIVVRRKLSDEPKQNVITTSVLTIPNILTMSRIACTPFIGHYIISNNLTPALCLFAYSCVTDFLDGFIARKYEMKSVAGTILDPIADKLLMIVTTIALAFSPGPQLIPLPIAGLILGRDVLLGLSALYYRYASMRQTYQKITWKSYWDFFHYPSAEVKPTRISKYNTFFQMIYLGCGVVLLIIKENEDDKVLPVEGRVISQNTITQCFTWMGYMVAFTTVLSGGSYVFSKDAVKFLKR